MKFAICVVCCLRQWSVTVTRLAEWLSLNGLKGRGCDCCAFEAETDFQSGRWQPYIYPFSAIYIQRPESQGKGTLT